MPSKKHIHKYFRKRHGKDYLIYACALPDCTHYLPADLIVGKRTICWVCGNVCIVYQDSNGVLARPHCKECTRSRREDSDELPPLMVPNVLPG